MFDDGKGLTVEIAMEHNKKFPIITDFKTNKEDSFETREKKQNAAIAWNALYYALKNLRIILKEK